MKRGRSGHERHSGPYRKFYMSVSALNGRRYFAVGSDFYAMGTHYVYTTADVLTSLLFLLGFAVVMYLFAWITFKRAVVT